MGPLGAINYRIAEGLPEGINIFLATDKGREKRNCSAQGDRLNYGDVKMSIQCDLMLR
ncbi:Glucuronide transport facilitator UidC [Salmonella enterica subsp. houtenae serovar 16:z4,z32:-- str. RKS3027]|nr:Glucuronide transport facilitator UidC [Salmonella enterica subsp. houtenae serovar 16:z4,z32:-- str. RKS3027]